MANSPQPTTRLKTQVPPAEIPGVQSLLTLMVGVVVVAALYLAREVMVPVTLAVLLSFVLAPLVGVLRRVGLPRVPAVVSAIVLALGVILVLGAVIGTQVAQLASDIPLYAGTVERKVETLRTMTVGRLSAMTAQLNRSVEQRPAAAPAPSNEPKPQLVEVKPPQPDPMAVAERVLAPVLGPLGTMAVVLIVAVFILLQREDLRDRIIRLFGSRDLHRTTAAMDEAGTRLSRYFLTQLLLNGGFGVVVGIGLLIIGVPNAMLWAIVAALFRFVPYIGAIGAAVMPLAMAAAVDPGWGMLIAVTGMFIVLEPLMGQVVEPLVYGNSTGLTPVAVVLSAIFWGWLWGPVGLILSMPLTLCLVVLGRHIERLEFIDVLLGDQPALTPAESFYQRILAGDADEALDQAEALLRDRSLSSYYDEVALKGLQLAANDSVRGVLTEDQLRNIQDAIDGVIVDLASHEDVRPAAAKPDGPEAPAARTVPETPQQAVPDRIDPAAEGLAPVWAGAAPVLCVAGRGPLDEAAGAMLAQVLAKHGLRARVVSAASVSRQSIAALDVTGVAIVCISFLEADGSPSALRYLVRRLRERMPGAPLLVGLWQADTTLVADERMRAAVGADEYVTTLRDAVNACVAAARASASMERVALPMEEALSGR